MIGAAIVLVALFGMAGFHFIEGWSWFDGLYMVVTTLTTIGYQEVHPLSHAGRAFNVGIIVAGVALVFLAIGALTQALLEFELQSFFGRRRMEREIGRLRGHYVICGAGRVGRSAARELARNAELRSVWHPHTSNPAAHRQDLAGFGFYNAFDGLTASSRARRQLAGVVVRHAPRAVLEHEDVGRDERRRLAHAPPRARAQSGRGRRLEHPA